MRLALTAALVAALAAPAAAGAGAFPGANGLLLFTVVWPVNLRFAVPASTAPSSEALCGVDSAGRTYRLDAPDLEQSEIGGSWSGDGALIAAEVVGPDASGFVNSSLRVLRPGARGEFLAYGSQPSLSLDGSTVAYAWDGSAAPTDAAPTELWTIGMAGGAARRITDVGGADHPVWALDGTIAYSSGGHLFAVAPGGANVSQLTFGPGDDAASSWSPDRSELAFARTSGGVSRVSIVGASDGRVRILGSGSDPRWSPDASSIAYLDGTALVAVATDGTHGRRLYRGPVAAVGDWQPLTLATPPLPPLPPCILWGTARRDRIVGSVWDDVLIGRAGGDALVGGGGGDQIEGDSGNDRLVGGTGRDVISAGAGDDVVVRDGARDVVSCGRGRDVVFADRRDRVARDCERVRRPQQRGPRTRGVSSRPSG